MNPEPRPFLCVDQAHHVFEQLVDINGLLVRHAARAEQGIDETGEAVGLADDDVGVFALFVVIELALEQLRGAANPAQRVLDLVGQLPNHLSPGAVLDQQRIFAADLRAASDVRDFDKQGSRRNGNRRDTAIDDPLFIVNLGRREAQLVRVLVAGGGDAAENLLHFRLVIHEAQQGLASRARTADAEYVFSGRVQVDDEQMLIQQDDARVQAVEDTAGVVVQRPVSGAAAFQRTVVCCT